MVTRLFKDKSKLKPGDVLLSHGETPHYHRRYCVSLLSSAWVQVGPQCYGRQANFLFVFSFFEKKLKAKINNSESCFSITESKSYITHSIFLFESIKTLWVLYG